MAYVQDRLRKEMKKRGLNVTEAAKQLDITRPAFSNVINGNADLSMELAIKIQVEWKIDASKLLYRQMDEKLARLRVELFAVEDEG